MINNLFSIPVYKTKISGDWGRDNVIRRLDNYFQDQLDNDTDVDTLHQELIFQPIVQFMNKSVAEYWQQLDYDPQYPVEITSMWANCMIGKHQFPYPIENHGPAVISVVFYIHKTAEMGDIYFENPLETIWTTQPLSDNRRYVNNRIRIPTITGDLLCFPSWLNHAVDNNTTDERRLVVAADYELRGLNHIKRMVGR